jgi:hypothetical protein
MRWLSLIAAFVLLFVSLFAFLGGVGPLVAIGEYSDSFGLPNVAIWLLQLAYLGMFLGGVICCIVWFRGLRHAFGSALDRPATVGDRLVWAGHLAFLAALANGALWKLRLLDWDLLYLLLMVAAALFSLGLGALALTFRSSAPHAP